MNRPHARIPSLHWWIVFVVSCLVGFALSLAVLLLVGFADAEPLVLSGQEAQQACRARCDTGDAAFVEPAALIELLRQRQQLRDDLEQAQRELAVERAKPRCGA